MEHTVYDVITQRVIERLEAGVIPWQRTWAGGGCPKNLVSRKEYRGINPLILNSMGYGAPDWLTFKQAQSLGGGVKKGEKATPVIFWNWFKKQNESTGKDDRIPFLRYYSVFNVEQCEGLEYDIEDMEINPDTRKVKECDTVVNDFLTRDGHISIEHKGNRACYCPSLDKVSMPEFSHFESKEAYHATLFHELTHATGAKERLNRFGTDGPHHFGSKSYSKEELIAEMGAAFLCSITGIENSALLDNSAAYLDSWIKALKGDSKLLVQAGGKAQRAVDLILGHSYEGGED
jgi:antirestriction protein ArdC